jgi:hypothetical protein
MQVFESIQRYRESAARGGRVKRRRGRSSFAMRASALALIEAEPRHAGELRLLLNITQAYADMLVTDLLAEEAVIVIGTAEQAGKPGVRRDARMFALPGTPQLPPVDEARRRLVPRKPGGSGQFAGPCYHRGSRWGAGW